MHFGYSRKARLPNFSMRTPTHKKEIIRRALIASQERQYTPIHTHVRMALKQTKGAIIETVRIIRKEYGIALPDLIIEWDEVPIQDATPSHTLNNSNYSSEDLTEVRVIIHLQDLEDDTSSTQLEKMGISHLIGVEILPSQKTGVWATLEEGGMVATIQAPIKLLAALLHDVMLDIAMAHARGSLWSGFRQHYGALMLAALKTNFAKFSHLTERFPYGQIDHCTYLPLAACVRGRGSIGEDDTQELDLQEYIKAWTNFADYINQKQATYLSRIDISTRHSIAQAIHASHSNGGQISLKKLIKALESFSAGHYILYFHVHKVDNIARAKKLSYFFKKKWNDKNINIQSFKIYPINYQAKFIAPFVQEGYVSIYSFYLSE